ncbi:Metal-dependent hydrolase lscR like protein [Verticillium longisporum]|uniref:Metal-dependent hydrolase lscR like protein n=1 Tax=Verticillium longisporum TaxID=100787 RepID=A0A8I2ZW61_VERLO|nr:Metal-dependent hydrolase lscR like protein [Verticillium longisporum]
MSIGKLRSLFRSFKPQAAPSTSHALIRSSAPMAAVALAVASYTSSITKLPESTDTPEDARAKPHHVTKNGSIVHFKNPHPSYQKLNPVRDIVWPTLKGDLKTPDTSPPTVNVVPPKFLPTRHASDKLRATWLGHACYYVEFPSGLRVLFDPVFEDRCSPFSFLGPKRFAPKPCELSDIPFVDAVVISHSHYDHLSHTSVLELQKHNPKAHFFVGLGLESWFKSAGLKNVTELDWWDSADLTLTIDKTNHKTDSPETISATISCLPCQHTSARTLWDTDTTLWCSWAVKTGGRSVWFGGDTGYRMVPRDGMDLDSPEFKALPTCPQFKQIGQHRGPFDLGLIPIGAYYPRVAFSSMHANPYDSVEIFRDTRCQRAMGIHWGTWALTMEEVLEPPKLLQKAMEWQGLPAKGVFDVCDIGESREF